MANVLVVDGSELAELQLAETLQDQGHEVLTASTGAGALDTLSAARPDVILAAVTTPKTDGAAVCRRLQANPRFCSVPIILVAAQHSAEEVIRGLDAGAYDYLTRPFAPPVLVARVRAAVRLKKNHDAIVEEAEQLREKVRRWTMAENRFRMAAGLGSNLVYEWDALTDTLEWFGDGDGGLGYQPGELPQTIEAWLALVHPDDRTRIREAVERYRQAAEVIDEEYRIKAKDRAWRYWSARGRPLLDANGQRHKWIGVCKDITERKRAERQLEDYAATLESQNRAVEQLCRDAESANRAKSEFLANMSHEIRTPMTAILGFAEIIHADMPCCTVCPQHRACETRRTSPQHIQEICANGRHLLGIVNDILDLSRVEAQQELAVERSQCSPWKIVEEVVSSLKVRADAKGIRLEPDYHYPLPQTICTDAARLRQILVNLLSNAIKFTEEGGVRVTVRYGRGPDSEPCVFFAVSDTGTGMTQEQLPRVFQPFIQADTSASRRAGGSGLGLAISKALAEALGGRIEAESNPGKGSTFTLTLDPGPIDRISMLQEPVEPLADLRRPAETPAASPVKLGCRILLAEDGLANQRLLSILLEKAGAEVGLAENGQIALEKAAAARDAGEPCGLILMDMQMPVTDGYEATRQLREQGDTIPIVALTAHAMNGDREKCLAAGCDDYLSKPMTRKKLLELVVQYTAKTSSSLPARTASHVVAPCLE